MKSRALCSILFLLIYGVFLAFVSMYFSPHAFAQSFFDGDSAISLKSTPQIPSPNERVTISLDDYSTETVGGTIVWFVDGVEQVSVQDERAIEITVPDLGVAMTVGVEIQRIHAPTLRTEKTFVPVSIDLIIESDTYVPWFYKGKKLPSEESTIRAIAIIHDGSERTMSSYTYRWAYGNSVLYGGHVKGKNVAEFALSRYDNKPLMVEVFDDGGTLVGRRIITLETAEPMLLFYEENVLRGLSERTITNPYPLIGDESTLYGEPYFINARMENTDATFTWSLNGTETRTNMPVPNALTLSRQGDSGNATVDLSIVTRARIPQFLEQTFDVFFQ